MVVVAKYGGIHLYSQHLRDSGSQVGDKFGLHSMILFQKTNKKATNRQQNKR
jgi:hypothetical protein